MRNVSDKNYREHQNTHFISNKFIWKQQGPVWDNVEKYGRGKQATDNNIMMSRKSEISMPEN